MGTSVEVIQRPRGLLPRLTVLDGENFLFGQRSHFMVTRCAGMKTRGRRDETMKSRFKALPGSVYFPICLPRTHVLDWDGVEDGGG